MTWIAVHEFNRDLFDHRATDINMKGRECAHQPNAEVETARKKMEAACGHLAPRRSGAMQPVNDHWAIEMLDNELVLDRGECSLIRQLALR